MIRIRVSFVAKRVIGKFNFFTHLKFTPFRKKDCKKRQKYIEDKIANGELDQDYYGVGKKINSRDTSNSSKRQKKRGRSHSRRKDRERDISSSLSFSIPSDCASCKRVLKERKRKSRKAKLRERSKSRSKSRTRSRKLKHSLSPK